MIKLNLGCGADYRSGWVNVDFNKDVKADVYADLSKKLPFKDNSVDLILLDNVLEHVPRENYFKFLDELYRITKPTGKIVIFVPHFTSIHALKHPAHYTYFGVGSFEIFKKIPTQNQERYSKARFEVITQRLLFFHHNPFQFKFLAKIPINWLFNFNPTWQYLMERFQCFGFDEIKFEPKVIK